MQTQDLSLLSKFPAVDEKAVHALLQTQIDQDHHKLVVLDDDPTGVQTVHDVSVYTTWDQEAIRQAFAEKQKVFYILTNTRGMTAAEAAQVNREIAQTVSRVSRETGRPYLFMSRSDSTLRGHYPLETQVLREEMESDGLYVSGEIMAPFFLEGGRYTIDNIHYVRQGDVLVPAGDTEFAKDKTFGYSHSSLPEYIEEKTGGAYRAEDVTCISLEDLRALRLDKIEAQLLSVENFGKVCVNAVDYVDLEAFSIALYRAMKKGKIFLFRTAAGLVKVMGGIPDAPLLTSEELIPRQTGCGGLVVVGSHTEKTTAQLQELLKLKGVEAIAFDSNKILDGPDALDAEVNRCVAREEEIICSGKTAVCYTCRQLLSLETDTKEAALLRSIRISDGVQSLVSRLKVTPAFLIAKGGITSSDIGTKALAVRRANVMGQIRPGIPVWQTGEESRFPQIPYVIFPGNTGSVEDLRLSVQTLTGTEA